MNLFTAMFRAPFVMMGAAWQIALMLIQFVGLAWALGKLAIIIVRLIGRVLRNAYYRWF